MRKMQAELGNMLCSCDMPISSQSLLSYIGSIKENADVVFLFSLLDGFYGDLVAWAGCYGTAYAAEWCSGNVVCVAQCCRTVCQCY